MPAFRNPYPDEESHDDYIDLNPDPACLIESIRDIGYTLETAVADIIDNSISAAAKNIHINIDFNEKRNDLILEIIDDGFGMNREQLKIAMKLGSKNPKHIRAKNDLGRFGLGLKTASFSQCRKLTVESFSRENEEKNSFTWDLDKIVKFGSWKCKPNKNPMINFGTKIIWEKFDRLGIDLEDNDDSNKNEQIQIKIGEIAARIEKHISLIFHRFIDDKSSEKHISKIQIFLNKTKIKPLNPFNESNNATYISPITKTWKSAEIRHYILPHKDKCEGNEYEDYAGEEGYLENQGFYVYRNYRLITWGTWFRIIDKLNAYKLCRVKIDIGNNMDSDWRIDVKKSNAIPPKKIREFLEEYIPRVEIKGKRVFEHKANKYSTDDRYQIWIPSKIKRTKVTTFTLNKKNALIKKIINNIEHGEEIIKEIEESVPYELINLHINDTKQKFQAIFEPDKQAYMDKERKILKTYREDNLDDMIIKQIIMKQAELRGIDLTNDDIEWIMQ